MFRIFSSCQKLSRPSVASSSSSRQSSSAPPAMFQYPAPSSQPPSSGTTSSHRSSIPQARITVSRRSASAMGSLMAQHSTLETIQGVQLHRSFRMKPIHQKS